MSLCVFRLHCSQLGEPEAPSHLGRAPKSNEQEGPNHLTYLKIPASHNPVRKKEQAFHVFLCMTETSTFPLIHTLLSDSSFTAPLWLQMGYLQGEKPAH